MDGIHIVDKSFHGLMYSADGLIHGMLKQSFFALQTFESLFLIVFKFNIF